MFYFRKPTFWVTKQILQALLANTRYISQSNFNPTSSRKNRLKAPPTSAICKFPKTLEIERIFFKTKLKSTLIESFLEF